MKVIVPGKVILSGEHAVIYNKTALAMAINRSVTLEVSACPQKQIIFSLLDSGQEIRCDSNDFFGICAEIKKRFHLFEKNEISIRNVLKTPVELGYICIQKFLEFFKIQMDDGLLIEISSSLVPASGMGSSAAFILALISALEKMFTVNLGEEKYLFCLEVEHYQHGQSSGLDIKTCMQGGLVYFGEHAKNISLDSFEGIFIHTGNPKSNTGECVTVAKKYMSDGIISQFKSVTENFCEALIHKDKDQLKSSVKTNHRLLQKLHVVPQKVSQFIDEIEKENGAAKICGAGSVIGDEGGIVMICSPVPSHQNIIKKYNFTLLNLQMTQAGITYV